MSPELRFHAYTYDRKLDSLDFYEDKLLQADRDQQLNRQDIKTVCRMQESISQSYFFLDHQAFEEAHKIFNVQFEDLRGYLGLDANAETESQRDSEEAAGTDDPVRADER